MVQESLPGLTLQELENLCSERAYPPRIARELAYWIYRRREISFEHMNTFPGTIRKELAGEFKLSLPGPVDVRCSTDGSLKYLFPVDAGQYVETVYIPESTRQTLCLSTQSGCRMGCKFCRTGMSGYHGNLTAREMLTQLLGLPQYEMITNLVFMGMGEPLDNLPELLKVLDILTGQYGLAISPRKITVSTVGLIPQIKRFLISTGCNLTLSLHSPFSEERAEFIPAERKHPLRDLLEVIKGFHLQKGRRISVAYMLLAGINDTDKHLDEITALLEGSFIRVNLIHYHRVPGLSLQASPPEVFNRFFRVLNDRGISATVRKSRGLDIDAACGMLAGRTGDY